MDPSLANSHMQMNQQFGFGNSAGGGLESMLPPNDQNANYYQEYCRLFIANVVLTTQMKELIAEKNEILQRISDLERGEKTSVNKKNKSPETHDDKKSRIRRKANEVERLYKCTDMQCQKSYGSEGSLFQHMKLKHPELTEDPDWKMKLLTAQGHTQE